MSRQLEYLVRKNLKERKIAENQQSEDNFKFFRSKKYQHQKKIDIAIVGGGISGIVAAYYLSKANFKVTLFEKNNYLGGLASSFRIDNQPLERFYHHIFQGDKDFLKLIKTLNLNKDLFFSKPKIGVFYDDKLYPFSGVLDYLRFPPISFWGKISNGIQLYKFKYSSWQNLPHQTTQNWLNQKVDSKCNQILWSPMLSGKFGQEASNIALPWFWARIKSRSSHLGYIKGGFETLITALKKEIINNGGRILLNSEINNIHIDNGINISDEKNSYFFNNVLLTTSPQIFKKISPKEMPKQFLNRYFSQKYFGSTCLILNLTQALSPYYWVCLNDKTPFTVLVEHTNFPSVTNFRNHIVYLNRYTAADNNFFYLSKNDLTRQALPLLKKINPSFQSSWIKKSYLFREPYAQPIVNLKYARHLPPIKTPIKGLYYTSMAQIYPYDRGMNYAVSYAKKTADNIIKDITCA